METTDEAIKNAVEFDRAAIIRLIEAHAADCERRGVRLMAAGYSALMSEIEDAMHHDAAHVEALENRPPVPSWASVLTVEETADIRAAAATGNKIVRYNAIGNTLLSNGLLDTRNWVYDNWTALCAL